MGLDMYLNRQTYVANWSHMKPEERHTIVITGPCAAYVKPERVKYVEEEVMYWRKANAIHGWFVRECQDGVDECQTADVDPDKLVELRDLCCELLALKATDPAAALDLATKKLPPTRGFFFGSDDLDAGYWEDVQNTADALTELLNEPGAGNGTYRYHASW